MPTYNNKIVLGNESLIDLTGDTVTPEKVLSGETFHDRSGAPQTGSLTTHTYTAGDGIDITNSVISVDEMASADMDEIITPLPSVQARLPRYSTDEQVAGYWLDGKPIYQKTIDFGAGPNATTKSVAHNISNLSRIIDIKVIGCATSTPAEAWTLNYAENTSNMAVCFTDNSGRVCIKSTGNATSEYYYVTLYYTKAT